MTTTPACPDQTTENIASYDSHTGQLSLAIPPWVGVMSKKGKGKDNCTAVHGTPSHSYGVSLAIWDHAL